MLLGPPSKNNGGAADVSAPGLLAYAAGSSITIVDVNSMQLVFTFSLSPHPSSVGTTAATSLSPFITAIRWSSIPLIPAYQPDSWALAVLSGSLLLSLYNIATGRCFFKYDSSPEYFSCLRRDPFDARHFCALGLKGFLLSVKLLGDSENDVISQEVQIRADTAELQRLERDSSGSSTNNWAPALSVFHNYVVKFAFSPHWKHVILVGFPRELVVFDLQYQSGLPRGCGKFFEVLPDANTEVEVLYCAHLDGKLSTWRRKEGEQAHMMCLMEELIPSIGTSVPSPSVLAVTISQSDSTLQSIHKHCSDASSIDVDFDNPFDFHEGSLIISKTHLIYIFDDGKIWKWLLTAEGYGNAQKDIARKDKVTEVGKVPMPESESSKEVMSTDDPILDAVTQSDKTYSNKNHRSSPASSQEEVSFKGPERNIGKFKVVPCMHIGGLNTSITLNITFGAGALQEALAALREAQLPDTAAMFIFACHEILDKFLSIPDFDGESDSSSRNKKLNLPGLNPENEDVIAVGEYYGQYQRKLVHLCMDSQPYSDSAALAGIIAS
ncbi:WD repeat-containing 11 isoform X2 [Olea europaea subsp. europaea]|uniref:WD repeat-containing 11 isoform X2 n=1 Tax=Olea europaea subsp. europaea TaxID=158383 RepID=A0A8S0TA73_OLEEU|nr:WD repeat-containing 11 isoform X2 [Olea europaea subsp. europaea]